MPISEQGYLHWQGRPTETHRPWRAITRLGLRLAFKRKNFKFAFGVSLMPAVVFSIGVYLAETINNFKVTMGGRRQLLAVDPAYFRTYFTSDFLLFMMLMLMVLAGAGLIADDLRSNSLQLYFARPIRKRDYLLGKGDRPYRKAWSKRDALSHIIDQSGNHFDPEVVNAFVQMLREEKL